MLYEGEVCLGSALIHRPGLSLFQMTCFRQRQILEFTCAPSSQTQMSVRLGSFDPSLASSQRPAGDSEARLPPFGLSLRPTSTRSSFLALPGAQVLEAEEDGVG